MTRSRSRAKPARPYIWRLSIFVTVIRARRVGYLRTTRTASGAAAAQVMYSLRRGVVGYRAPRASADEAGPEVLEAAARQRPGRWSGRTRPRPGGVHRAGEAGCGAVARCRLRCSGWGTFGMPSRMPAMIAVRSDGRRAEVFRAAGAGSDHRAGQQARQPAGAGDRGQRGRTGLCCGACPSMRGRHEATAAGGNPRWLPARWKPVPYFG
jgi:hypothetical protein